MNYYDLPYVYDIGVAPYFNFPRPLYPPDIEATKAGPDVKAYKMIARHLGRWDTVSGVPGNADFDENYNMAFSHGSSNVGSSGIEGIQRQAGVAGANGVLGQRTFDILIYARIPVGLPNAGKLPTTLDDEIGELLRDAYQNFGEEDTVKPPPVSSPRRVALNHLELRVGFTEQPWGSNTDTRSNGIRTSQIHTAGGGSWLIGKPWCGCWCYYALESAKVQGIDSSLASVALIEINARAANKCFKGWTTDRSKVKPGDLVVVGGYGVHVETVRDKPLADGSVPTYGGNTSPGIAGSQSNGGGAYRRVRSPGEIRGFALVRYPGE